MFETKLVEKIKALFPKIVQFKKSRGKNLVDPDTPQMTIKRKSFECVLFKATDTT